LKKAKGDPRGFKLIVWWIHPKLQKDSVFWEQQTKKGSDGTHLKEQAQEQVCLDTDTKCQANCTGNAPSTVPLLVLPHTKPATIKPPCVSVTELLLPEIAPAAAGAEVGVEVGGENNCRYLLNTEDLDRSDLADLRALEVAVQAHMSRVYDAVVANEVTEESNCSEAVLQPHPAK
jgi:hypothetical protein